jgi:hypothetical protein
VTQRGEPGPAGDGEQQGRTMQNVRPAEAPKAAGAPARDDGVYGREERAEKDKSAERPSSADAATGLASAAPASPPSPPAATAEAMTLEGGNGAPNNAAAGDLAAARAAKARSGCGAALPEFDTITKKYPATDEANMAKQEALECKNEISKGQKAPAKLVPPGTTTSK